MNIMAFTLTAIIFYAIGVAVGHDPQNFEE